MQWRMTLHYGFPWRLLRQTQDYEAIAFVARNPGAGAPQDRSAIKGLRSWPVPGFEKLRVYYVQPAPQLVRVLRVLHGSRDVKGIVK